MAIDEVEVRVRVIEHAQEREARDPGPIGFPFEPMQLFGHLRPGRHCISANGRSPRHAPAKPRRSRPAAGRRLAQAEIERDEVEGFADPGDGRDHMQPADGEIRPIPGDGGSCSPPYRAIRPWRHPSASPPQCKRVSLKPVAMTGASAERDRRAIMQVALRAFLVRLALHWMKCTRKSSITSIAACASSTVIASAGLWLMPPLQRRKSMAIGQSSAIAMAS